GAEAAARDRAGDHDRDRDRPGREAGRLQAVVRRARARGLLPGRIARLLPHARVRPVDAGLHQRVRRDHRHGQARRARQAARRRAAADRRHLAPLPPVPRPRPHHHGAVYPARDMKARLALFAGTVALLVLVARWLVYALAPSPLARVLEHQAGGPSMVTVTLVSLGVAAGGSPVVRSLAALPVRARAPPRPA